MGNEKSKLPMNFDHVQLPNSAYFLNNQSGASAARSGYYQTLNRTTVSYCFWSWNFLDIEVKAFPAIITGWHLGYLNGQGSGGLPVIIHSNPSLLINWEVFHKHLGGYETLNTSVDIWLGNIEETNPTKPTTEVMIWMNHIHQRPLGFFIETIYIWGKPFDLYAYWGTSTKWKVFTFIQKQQTWAFLNSDLFDFFKYLWITKQWVDGRQYILGIEAGNEIIQGQGSFTHKYSLKVN